MGVSAILVIWPRPLEQTSVPWTQWRLHMKIGQVVSEEKMFEERGRQTGDGPAYTISSPMSQKSQVS